MLAMDSAIVFAFDLILAMSMTWTLALAAPSPRVLEISVSRFWRLIVFILGRGVVRRKDGGRWWHVESLLRALGWTRTFVWPRLV